jgi:transposase
MLSHRRLADTEFVRCGRDGACRDVGAQHLQLPPRRPLPRHQPARCAGLDVHKRTVVACLVTSTPDGEPTREVCTFGTATGQLLALGDWLEAAGVGHVAMESTGPYWKPVHNLLEARFTLLVVNAAHIKAVPGRKTDVRDAEWIAELLRHGLLRASFIPSRPERELRELNRYRTSLVQERSAEINPIAKVLEGANIKLGSVASNVVGVSGRAILSAIIDGDTDAAALADLARGRLRSKRPALTEATLERLRTIPGIGRRTAETLLAEIGPDMGRFPSSGHLASWAGLCPGNDESGGKRRSGRTRKGSPWLRASLVEAAQAAGRTRTYLGAAYRRLTTRRGSKRAAVAVAHMLLVIAYHVISRGEPYAELGANHFDELARDRVRQRLTRRLEALGYRVSLEPAMVPAT